MEVNDTKTLISAADIQDKVAELAGQVDRDYAGKNPLLLCVLKGAVVFLADFMRRLTVPVEIDFIAVSSYGAATRSSGVVRILKDLETSIDGRHILIVEDIIDTGLTLKYLAENIRSRGPASVKIVTLLDKPDRREVEIEPDYCGFRIPDKFVVGYGLDFNERYRQLPQVSILTEGRDS